MSITITTTPTYPAVGRIVTISFSLSGGGNWVKVFATDAPLGSDIKTRLVDSGATREFLYEGDSSRPWQFTPDQSGVYSLSIEEYTKGASDYGGGYEDAEDTYQTETVISTSPASLYVGQRLTQPIGYGKDTATLVVFVHNDTIRESTKEIHGFVSPDIIEPRTDIAETAALNSDVRTALDALIDVMATSALGDLAAIFDDLYDNYTAHRSDGVHANSDTDNVVQPAFKNPTKPEALKLSLGDLARKLHQHMRNDPGSSDTSAGGTGIGSYHEPGGFNRADWTSLPIVMSAGEQFEVIAMVADLWRAYEQHRVSAVHSGPDATNTLTALPALIDVHRLFLTEIAKTAPTAPATVNSGAVVLSAGAGFKEEDI